MPQEFQVLCCYKCSIFQVHQVKKGNKWQCKMCGEKQSMKKSYGVGTGKECRLYVQRLNTQQAEGKEQGIENISKQSMDSLYSSTTSIGLQMGENSNDITPTIATKITSKWAKFIQEEAEVETKTEGSNVSTEEQGKLFANVEVVLEMPQRKSKPLAKRSSIKIGDRDMIESSDVNSQNVEIKFASRWTERSESSQALDNRVDSHKRSTKRHEHNINNRHTKILKLDSTMPLPIAASQSFTDNMFDDDLGKKNVIVNKNAFMEPKISSNSKWFKFVDENAKDDNQIYDSKNDKDIHINNGSECETDENEYDVSSIYNLDDKENYLEDKNHVLDVNNGSDNREMKLDSDTELNKIKNIKSKTLFSLVDDEDLDSLLDF